MKRLFVIDLKDYDEKDKVFRRPSARGIIFEGDKIALVYSNKEKYYKFPGGGIQQNEDRIGALCREVKEEVGLTVIPSSVEECGSVLRRQRSSHTPDTIFEQENFCYFCRVEAERAAQKLDAYEKNAEFVLRFVSLEEAIECNSQYHSDDLFDEIMIMRKKKVLALIKEERNR